MTERSADRAATTGSTRRAAALLVAWVAAAVVAGTPGDAAGTANAEPRAGKVPVVVNSGPECFAGHSAPQARSKGRD